MEFLYSCQAVSNYELVPSQADLAADVAVVAVDVVGCGGLVAFADDFVVGLDSGLSCDFDSDMDSNLVIDLLSSYYLGCYSGSGSCWDSD